MPVDAAPNARNPSNPYAHQVNALDKFELMEIVHGLLSPAEVMGGLDGAFNQPPRTWAVYMYVLFEGQQPALERNKFDYLQDCENFHFAGAQYDDLIALFDFEGFEEELEDSCFCALKEVVEAQKLCAMPFVMTDAQRQLQENTAHNGISALGRPHSEQRAALKAQLPAPCEPEPEQDSDRSVDFNVFETVREYLPDNDLYFTLRDAPDTQPYPWFRVDLQPAWHDLKVAARLREDGVFVLSDLAPHTALLFAGPQPFEAEMLAIDALANAAAPEHMATESPESPEPLLTTTETVVCLVALQNLQAPLQPGWTGAPGEGH